MKKLLVIALGLSLIGTTLSTAGAQGTTGSSGAHRASKNTNTVAQHHHDRGSKKRHPGGKKGKK